jgi:hypothetical protein
MMAGFKDATTSLGKRVLDPLQIATIQVTGGGDAAPDEAVLVVGDAKPDVGDPDVIRRC